MPAKISNRYVEKISAINLLLLGGIKPEALKELYQISDCEIAQARRKIKALKLKDVKNID